MASGWNLWVWLPCIGVVSGCCCKEVYRYPHNNYYFSLLCISSFLGSSIPTFCSFKKCFSVLRIRIIESVDSMRPLLILLHISFSSLARTLFWDPPSLAIIAIMRMRS